MEKLAIHGGKPVRETKLHYGHQYIDDKDIQAVVDVLKSDFLTCGPKITELEDKLCKLTGAKYAVVCSNDTAALHIACMAAGVQEGDEVIQTGNKETNLSEVKRVLTYLVGKGLVQVRLLNANWMEGEVVA